MTRVLSALAIGLIFGSGISLSGMVNPAKVLNFFDFAGTWDPSLAFVMGGALIVTAIGYAFILKRGAPVFDRLFHLPTRRDIDTPLVAGSAAFGIGWGIAGFCPGGAVPALGLGHTQAWLFVGCMIVGIALARLASRSRTARAATGAAKISSSVHTANVVAGR
ncbi:MAG: YeeE/YedE family protein [Hyphomicrobiales bacterium]|nr:YeeE/YedE family protein [Hyphomicrobiales bacterium]